MSNSGLHGCVENVIISSSYMPSVNVINNYIFFNKKCQFDSKQAIYATVYVCEVDFCDLIINILYFADVRKCLGINT